MKPGLGFTGTRRGMTRPQLEAAERIISEAEEFRHGDCLGSDEEAHDLAIEHGIPVIIHPPTDSRWRAWCKGGRVKKAQGFLRRNRMIVRCTGSLLAAPAEATEQRRGGTWYTIRFAISLRRPVTVIFPSGEVTPWPIPDGSGRLRYEKVGGEYVLLDGSGEVAERHPVVALACDEKTRAVVRHGDPEDVRQWAALTRRKFCRAGLRENALALVTVESGSWDVDDLNLALGGGGGLEDVLFRVGVRTGKEIALRDPALKKAGARKTRGGS